MCSKHSLTPGGAPERRPEGRESCLLRAHANHEFLWVLKSKLGEELVWGDETADDPSLERQQQPIWMEFGGKFAQELPLDILRVPPLGTQASELSHDFGVATRPRGRRSREPLKCGAGQVAPPPF